jgi:hypothetical protein
MADRGSRSWKGNRGVVKDQNGNAAWDNRSLDACTVFGDPNDAPFGHPNSGYRGVSRGTLRAIDAKQN